MNPKQKERLSELKHKYYVKYILWPAMIICSHGFAFNFEDILLASKGLQPINFIIDNK